MRSQWGRYNLPIYIYILHDTSWLTSEQALAMMPYFFNETWMVQAQSSGNISTSKKKELHVFNTRVIYLLKWKIMPKQSNYNAPNRITMPRIVIECYTWSSHSNVDLYGISHCRVYFMEGNCMVKAVLKVQDCIMAGTANMEGGKEGFLASSTWGIECMQANTSSYTTQAIPMVFSTPHKNVRHRGSSLKAENK